MRYYYMTLLEALNAYANDKEVFVQTIEEHPKDDESEAVWSTPYPLDQFDDLCLIYNGYVVEQVLEDLDESNIAFFSRGEETYTLAELREWLKGGGKVRRLAWEGDTIWEYVPRTYPAYGIGDMVVKSDGTSRIAVGCFDDITATDWIKVEETE